MLQPAKPRRERSAFSMSGVRSTLSSGDERLRSNPNQGAAVKTSPYHSSNPSDPDVHHDHTNCPNGQQIPAANRRSGTGGFPRCGNCKRMD